MTLSAQALSDATAQPETNLKIAKLVASQLGNEIGATRFETWFGGGQCISVSNETIVFRGGSEFALQRMQTTFSKEIGSAVSRVCGPQFLSNLSSIRTKLAKQILPIAKPTNDRNR